MIFTLTGNIPSKKNSKRIITRDRRGRSLARPMLLSSDNHEYWYSDAIRQLRGQERPIEAVEKASVTITIYSENKRAGDLTNKAESIMDLLVDMEILTDDNWFVVGDLTLKFGGVDREDPRAIIEIREI